MDIRPMGRAFSASIKVRAPTAALVVRGKTISTQTIQEIKAHHFAPHRTMRILYEGKYQRPVKKRRCRAYVPTSKKSLQMKAKYISKETETGRVRKSATYDQSTEMSKDGHEDDADTTPTLKSLLQRERIRVPHWAVLFAYSFVAMMFLIATYITGAPRPPFH